MGAGDFIMDGLKAVGEAGLDAAKTVAQLPLTIATLPTDFIKNPNVFFGNGPRGLDLGAIFSKDYRKQKEADIKGAADFEKLQQHKQAVDWVTNMFTQQAPTSGKSPAEYAQGLRDQGIPNEYVQPALQQDYAQGQQRQQARQALGQFLPPEIAGFVEDTEKVPGLYVQNKASEAAAIERAGDNARQARAEGRAEETHAAADKRPWSVRNAEKNAAKKAAAAEAARVKADADAHALLVAEAKAEAAAQSAKVGRIFGRKTKALEKGDFAAAGVTDVNPKNSDYFPNFLQSGTAPIPSKTIEDLEQERVAAEKAARDAAYAGIDQALPLTSLKNIPARTEAKAAVDGAIDAAAETAMRQAAIANTVAAARQNPNMTLKALINGLVSSGYKFEELAPVLKAQGIQREQIEAALQ